MQFLLFPHFSFGERWQDLFDVESLPSHFRPSYHQCLLLCTSSGALLVCGVVSSGHKVIQSRHSLCDPFFYSVSIFPAVSFLSRLILHMFQGLPTLRFYSEPLPLFWRILLGGDCVPFYYLTASLIILAFILSWSGDLFSILPVFSSL